MVRVEAFRRALGGATAVGIDTALLIYHLEAITPYTAFTTQLFLQAARRVLRLMVSTVSVGEALVGPWRTGDGSRARRIESALRGFFAGALIADVDWGIARRGAEVRGMTGLPLPDALILASALEHRVPVVVTNDARWRAPRLSLRILVLEDYI